MKQSRENNNLYSLIDVLQAHYHQLVNLITELRLKSYRPAKSNAASEKFSVQLRNYINHFPATKLNISIADIQTDKHSEATNMKTKPHVTDQSKQTTSINHQPLYTDAHLVNTVGEKLMQSTWDHLHASIRYARSGNNESARLHASIMDSALKEAAHFLDDEVYSSFLLSLGKELGDLAWSNETHAIKQPESHDYH